MHVKFSIFVYQVSSMLLLRRSGFLSRRAIGMIALVFTVAAACSAYAQRSPDTTNSTTWLTQAVDLDVAGRTPVAIYGNETIVGTRNRVKVLQYHDGEWKIVGTIKAADVHKDDSFGFSVAIDGDTVVVGSPGASYYTGKAYVFVRQNDNTWKKAAELYASDAAKRDRFGSAVAISGDTVVIGAPCDSSLFCNPGAAYVFVKPANGWGGTLTETAKLVEDNPSDRDEYGYAVAISGNTIAVGGPFAPASQTGPGPGVADIFVKPPAGWDSQPQFTPTAVLIEPDAEPGDYFGKTLDVSGNTVAVGAPDAHSSFFEGPGPGYVYVYEAPPSGWNGEVGPVATLASGSDEDTFGFGSRVATFGTRILATDTGNYLFVEPPGGWSGNLLPTVNFVDMEALAGDLSQSTVMTEDGYSVNFTMPFQLSMTMSAPATVAQGDEFSTQVFVTNSSATTTLPASFLMDAPSGTSIIDATTTSGTCTVPLSQAQCALSPIPGNGGETSVSVKLRDVDPNTTTIQQDAFLPYTTPVLRAEGRTIVKFTPLVIQGFEDITVTAGHTGSETFAVSTATDAEPIRVNVTSFNSDLLPAANIGGASACVSAGTCRLTVKPVAGKTGQAGVMVRVSDQYGRSATGEFNVTVKPASNGGGGDGGGGGDMLLGLPFLLLLAIPKLLALRRRRSGYPRASG